MNGFSWTYTKRSNYRCPNCGQLRANRFENPATKEIAPERFAKCNRVNKCGYELRPDKPDNEIKHEPKPEPVLQPFFMPENWIAENKGDLSKNVLFNALCKIFSPARLKAAFELYNVCTDKYGATIFPQLDQKARCRTAKKIIYMSNGKRNKQYGASFLHHKNGFNPEKHALKQCLFGEHLITSQIKKIVVVESEKTAVICEVCRKEPDTVIVATGGLENLAFLLRCKIEKHQEIVLIPDNAAEQKWQNKIEKLGINGKIKPVPAMPELGKGYDIADVLINKKTKQ